MIMNKEIYYTKEELQFYKNQFEKIIFQSYSKRFQYILHNKNKKEWMKYTESHVLKFSWFYKSIIIKRNGLYNTNNKCLMKFKYVNDVPYRILKYLKIDTKLRIR